MDDKTKEALGEALKMLVDSLQGGKDFVIEQSPLLVQEIVSFGRAKHTILLSLAALSLVAFAWCVRKYWRPIDNFMDGLTADDACGTFVGIVVGSLVWIGVSIGVFCSNFVPSLEAWFAPRLYVLHQIKDML